MSTPSANMYFEAIHTSGTPPTDPNLFTAAELVAGSFDSAAVSTATSKAVSTVNAAAPDSTSISQANSRAVSAASVGSVADSKAVSNSAPTSIADSKSISNSVNISIADSKAVSLGVSTPVVTAVVYSGAISVADSKAVSDSVTTSTADSKAVSASNILPTGSGRTVTTLDTYLRNNAVVNVKDFGARGDGVTDDTAAMQLAHNLGLIVYYPAGTYLFSSTVTLASGGGIVGAGKQLTILSSSTTDTSQLIKITSNYASHLVLGVFRDFSIGTPTNVKTAGACIQVSPATGESSYLHFDNIYFYNCPIHLDFVAASLWKVVNCDFLTFATAGIKVANTNTVDSGDSTIAHCMFNNDLSTGSAILQLSSGGLRVIGNKMLGGAYGYRLTFNSTTTATGTLLINGNSIEQQAQIGVSFERTAGANAFKNIIISDNEFGNSQRHISTDGSATFISELVITGNLFHMNGGAGTIYGVNLNQVVDFLIANNQFRGEGGTSQGVVCTSCTTGRVGPNYYANIVTANVTLTTCTSVEQWDANALGSGNFYTNWVLQHAGSVIQELQSTDAILDTKRWRIYATNAGTLIIDAVKDDGSTAAAVLTLSRLGALATGITAGAAINEVLNIPSEATLVSGIDCRSGNGVIVTLTAARVVGVPLNPVTGQRMTFTFVQGGAGGWAITWNVVFKVVWSDTGNTTGKRSTVEFRWDGGTWCQVGGQATYV